MVDQEKAQVEQIKQQEDVKRALQQTATNKEAVKPVVETKHKVWFGTYALLLLGLGVLYYLLGLKFFGFAAPYVPLLQRLTTGAMAVVLVLTLAKAVEVYLIGLISDTDSQYNLKRVLRLIVGLVLAFIVI